MWLVDKNSGMASVYVLYIQSLIILGEVWNEYLYMWRGVMKEHCILRMYAYKISIPDTKVLESYIFQLHLSYKMGLWQCTAHLTNYACDSPIVSFYFEIAPMDVTFRASTVRRLYETLSSIGIQELLLWIVIWRMHIMGCYYVTPKVE